jgi:hypothetical protein
MATKNCTICYEDKVYLAYGFLPCMHTFCIKCIRKFKRKECPLCRTEFLNYTPSSSSLPIISNTSPPVFFSRSIDNSELIREKLEKKALERLERRRNRRELRRQKKPKKVSRVKKDDEIFKLDEEIKPKKKPKKKYRNNRSNRWNSLRAQIN